MIRSSLVCYTLGMKVFNVYDAKTHFSKLLNMAEKGEEVVVAKNGKPMFDLKLRKPKKNKIKFGAWTGMIDIPDEKLVGVDSEIQELVYGKDWDKK